MATSYKTQQFKKITATVFFLVMLMTCSSLSSARLLNDHDHHHHQFVSDGLPATEPTFNLALPVDEEYFDKLESEQAVSVDPKPQQHLPCDHYHMIKNSHVGIINRRSSPRLAGKYGPMILNMLPKGPVPSSGPSKGTNDIKN